MLEYLKPEYDGYKTYRGFLAALILGLGGVFVLALSGGVFTPRQDVPELRLAAYTMPREAYMKILPQFATFWRERTGQHIYIEESYRGSGEQARALVDGDEVDVAASVDGIFWLCTGRPVVVEFRGCQRRRKLRGSSERFVPTFTTLRQTQ